MPDRKQTDRQVGRQTDKNSEDIRRQKTDTQTRLPTDRQAE